MLLTALPLTLLLLSGTPGKPRSDTDRLAAQIQGTPEEQRKAIDFAIAHTPTTPSLLMFLAATKALEVGRLEDAGFLFYAAQLRSRFDRERLPPIEVGGDSPAVLLAAMNQQVGAVVNPALMREPKSFKAVIDRLRRWDLNTSADYDPGWLSAASMPDAEVRALAAKVKRDYLGPAEGIVTLLNDPEYFKSWKTLQDYNLGSVEDLRKPERIAEMQQAEKRLREIEERLKIRGLFYGKPSPPPMPEMGPAPATAAADPAILGRKDAIAQLRSRGYPQPDDAAAFVGAAMQGQEDLVRLFLAAGMPVDTPNHVGDRALLMAIRGAYVGLAADLLKAGAQPNLADQNGYTPLIELSEYCDETALVAAVLEAGANVNAKARNGTTSLQSADAAGCGEIARMLRKAGAVR